MKIHIGKYITWWGPYQIAALLQYIGVSRDKCRVLGGKLSNTWVNDFLRWIHSHRKQKVKIQIDDWDIWNMDATLALIILPMLKQLRKHKQGSPMVDDEDVPEELGIRSTNFPNANANVFSDDGVHERWKWVLDEMIWAFEQMNNDSDSAFFEHSEKNDSYGIEETLSAIKYDREAHDKHSKRVSNGTRLFGKYYQGLWD